MRRLALTTFTLIAFIAPASAQDFTVPTLTFPQPGTFCGPLHLCAPVVTRDASD